MEDHLNAFNNLVSQLIFVDIKMEEDDKCITLLCVLPNSWKKLGVVIGSNRYSTLKIEDVVTSLLAKEMRRKSMENHSTDSLLVRPSCSKNRRNKSTEGAGGFKSRGT